MELRDIKVSQLGLEFTESAAGIANDIRVFHAVVSHRGNVVGQAPEVIPVDHISLTVCGVMEMQRNTTGALTADMLRYFINIIHQFHRLAERICIDILHQIGLGVSVRLNKLYFVSLIHVAHLNGFAAYICAFDPEQAADFLKLLIDIHSIYPLANASFFL